MFHFGIDSHSFAKEPQHDFTSLAHQKGRWKDLSVGIVFSKVQDQALCVLVNVHLQSSIMNVHLQSSIKNLHLQSSIKSSCCVKLSLTSQSLHLFGTQQYIGASHRVSIFHSNLVTTPSSSIDLTFQSVPHKDPMQYVGKNGEHFYGENWHNITKNGENSNCKSNLVTKDLMHHTGRNGEHSCR